MRSTPFLDLTKQIITASPVEGDDDDQLRVRSLLLEWGEGTPFWGNYPATYETVRFAKNILLPGHCKVTGKGFAQKLQRDSPAGTHGHKVKQSGIQAAKFQISVRMWTAEHLEAFARLIPLLKQQRYKTTTTTEAVGFTGSVTGTTAAGFTSAAGATGNSPGTFTAGYSGVVPGTTKVTKKSVPVGPKPIDVYHPMLALFKIRSVLITEVSIPVASSDGDIWESTIECEEFIYKPSTVQTPTSSQDLLVIEKNVGKTAATIEQERRASAKPSKFSKAPPNTGGASGGW